MNARQTAGHAIASMCSEFMEANRKSEFGDEYLLENLLRFLKANGITSDAVNFNPELDYTMFARALRGGK